MEERERLEKEREREWGVGGSNYLVYLEVLMVAVHLLM